MNKLSITFIAFLISSTAFAIEIITPKEIQKSIIQINDPDQNIKTLGQVAFQIDLSAAHDDLLALKVRRSDLVLKDGRKFTAFGVHKDAGIIIIAGGEVSHISISSVNNASGTRDASVLFYGKNNEVISPSPHDISVFNAEFEPLAFSYTPLQTPGSLDISVSIALDLSGSMAGHEVALARATKTFMLGLPEFTKCQITVFSNDVYHLTPQDYNKLTSCPSSAYILDRPLKANGATALYKAIKTGFQSGSHRLNKSFPNIALVITDGMNTVDYGETIASLKLDKALNNSKLFVFWAGNYQKGYLNGLADLEFISTANIDQELNKFFNALGVSLSGLQVLHIGQ